MRKFRVLGVDPAVAGATGYGIVEFDGNTPRLVRFGALKLPGRATFASRLREIHQLISQLVDSFGVVLLNRAGLGSSFRHSVHYRNLEADGLPRP